MKTFEIAHKAKNILIGLLLILPVETAVSQDLSSIVINPPLPSETNEIKTIGENIFFSQENFLDNIALRDAGDNWWEEGPGGDSGGGGGFVGEDDVPVSDGLLLLSLSSILYTTLVVSKLKKTNS